MRRKSLIVFAVALALVSLQSCKSHPEQRLLQSYFNASSMNDVTTMSTMAVDPIKLEAASWSITTVSAEQVEPAALTALGQKEAELKKQYDQSVAPTLDAKDTLDIAKDEYNSARTAAAKGAAKAKMDEAQKKYDAQYEANRNILKDYNDAKAVAAKEEEITSFSLGAGQLPNIRDLKGTVHVKDVELQVKAKDGTTQNWHITMRMYDLKDEAANVAHRGRWVITKFEKQ
jgi:hypothetical protein